MKVVSLFTYYIFSCFEFVHFLSYYHIYNCTYTNTHPKNQRDFKRNNRVTVKEK